MQAAADTEPQTGPGAWHAVGADEVVSGLGTDPANGLDAGDVGSCPQCGEPVLFAAGFDPEAKDKAETIAKIVAQVSGGSPPEELAA